MRVRSAAMKPGSTRPVGTGRKWRATPCSTLSMAMVVMTGLMCRRRTMAPLMTPTASPAARQASVPPNSTGISTPMPIRKDAATTVMLISDPTDMSNPPTSSAFNWAMATRASGAVASSRCRPFSGERKASDWLEA